MRHVNAQWPKRFQVRIGRGAIEQLQQARFVVLGKDEGRPESMLALDGTMRQNLNRGLSPLAPENTPRFQSTFQFSQTHNGLHADILKNVRRTLQSEA